MATKVIEEGGYQWFVRDSSQIGKLKHDSIASHGEREGHFMGAIVNFSDPNSLFLDIGSHTGFFSIRTAKLFKEVHSFEANPFNYDGLFVNIKLNELENVIAHNVAVGDNSTLVSVLSKGASSKVISKVISKEEIKAGDKLFKNVPMHAIDFYKWATKVAVIKIDTEGCEEQVLNGAIETILEHQPAILIETHQYDMEGYTILKGQMIRLKNILKAINYQTITLFKAKNGDEHWLCTPITK